MIVLVARNLDGLRSLLFRIEGRLVSRCARVDWLKLERERAIEIRELHAAFDALEQRALTLVFRSPIAEA